MKNGRWKYKFNIISAILVLCGFVINFLSDNYSYGRWYFISLVILYSLFMILLTLYPIIGIIDFNHGSNIKVSQIVFSFILTFIGMPLLIFSSVNYYKDLFNGITEIETEVYKIPLKSFYEKFPNQDKCISLSYNGYYTLIIDDDIYFDLINNNPVDETRTVYDPLFGEEVNPHLHHIKIRFYENTKIVDTVQILYD